jgi:ubiquinone/menaquinone biosynthesis C-methylase UbiE
MNGKQYFDDVADQWDELRASFFSESVREEAFAVAGVQPGRLAADIGAGTGFVTEGLIEKGLRVIAIDRSEAMLAELERKFGKQDGVECRTGEAENLPVPDCAVDYAFANMCLHHVESPSNSLSEIVRILKPGGVLVVTDLDEHDFEFLRAEHRDRWMGFKREDVAAWLSGAGLKDVQVGGVGQNCCAESSDLSQSARISIFVASGKKR